MRRIIIIIFIIVIAFLAVYLVRNSNLNNVKAVQPDQIKQEAIVANALIEDEVKTDFITMTFAGDAMLDRRVRTSVNKNFGGDYNELFKNVDIFKNDDISFLNLEGPVSDVGKNVGSIYSFRMDPSVIGVLANTGIDIVSFANNHVGDYSMIAFKDTLRRLQDGNMLFTGAGLNYDYAIEPTVIEKNNIKTCFLGFSDVGPVWIKATKSSPGILLANDPNFEDIVYKASMKCDVLAVSFHFGEEYKPHTTRQEKLAQKAIDSGADIVVGAHPHVAQDIQIYKGKPIMYSLGNFMFDQYFSEPTMQGLIVQMKVYKTGEVKDIKEYISKQNSLFQIESVTETSVE
jgi:poly-gamma-glutamate capsule biosynthesis protein CapA/YwtB (metallophosphatase superfamily)